MAKSGPYEAVWKSKRLFRLWLTTGECPTMCRVPEDSDLLISSLMSVEIYYISGSKNGISHLMSRDVRNMGGIGL